VPEQPPTYLDYNATAPLLSEAREAMLPWLCQHHGNPSSVHAAGQHAREAVESARDEVAALLGAPASDVVLTPSATIANNLAIRGVVAARASRGGQRHLVCTRVEHPSVLETVKAFEADGHPVTWLDVDGEGRLDPAAFSDALRDDSALACAMLANNETGVLLPVAELAAAARERGVPLLTDAVQAASTSPLPAATGGADLIVVSSHKLGGPQGAGALLAPRRLRLRPLITGGHQERGLVAGTENVAALVGFGAAARIARKQHTERALAAARLRDRLERSLLATIPGCRINGGEAARLPTTLNVSFDDTEGETLLVALDVAGVSVASGSACTAGSLEPSHVLLAMGMARARARAALRISVGFGTTDADVDRVLEVLPDAVAEVRAMAP